MTALPGGETPGRTAEDRERRDPGTAADPSDTNPSDANPGGTDGRGPSVAVPSGETADADGEGDAAGAGKAAGEGADAGSDRAADEPTAEPQAGAPAGTDGGAAAAGLSETETELAAQRELRERIEKRKAEKEGPIAAGGKLSGTAADLLAAVRAVESGEKAGAEFFDPPAATPAARRAAPAAAPAPTRQRTAEPSRVPQGASADAVAGVRAVLADGGAPEALAPAAAATLGEQAADILRADPWQLLAVHGVRPEQADGFARALLGAGCGPDDERRTAALIAWLLERAALRGHSALDVQEVRAALAEHAVTDPGAAVHHAIAEGVVLVFQEGIGPSESQERDGAPHTGETAGAAETDEAAEDGDDAARGGQQPVQVLLGLDRYALAEESLADGLARLISTCEKDADWSDVASGAPSPSAAELIRTVAGAGLVVHSGGESARTEPAALLAAAQRLGLRALGATHSVDGRHRLAAATGNPRSAATLWGLLSGAEGPGRDTDGAFALDLLVVLDAPQLDVESAAMLVEALADGTRLVLSGDPGVLGSAGAGRVFADVLAARACPQVISRTPDPGPIGELVSGIGSGELSPVGAPGREVVIVPVRDAGEAVHRTVQLVADSVPRAIGVPSSETQVITVGHGGPAGTRTLNTALKQRLNPGPGRFGGFDPGDRVVHVPAPGRGVPATVVSADAEGLHLDCSGGSVVVPPDLVESSVRHGWALSAHQAAGMRWPAVVVVLPGDAAGALSRPWVYTAFSRGERHLSVVHGVEQALARAVAEVPAQERTTRLRQLLESLPVPDGGAS